MTMAKTWAITGEICPASTKAGMSDAAVASMCPRMAVQHRAAAPKMHSVDRSIPERTDLRSFLLPISAMKAANQRITKPP